MYSKEIIIYLLSSCLKMQVTILKFDTEAGLILSRSGLKKQISLLQILTTLMTLGQSQKL